MDSIPQTSGVYKIVCTATGKVYVGSSEELRRRIRKHRERLRTGRHENSYLQNAWDKYGESAFEFAVLELVLPGFCLEREQYWLDKTKAYDRRKGYNLSLKAGAPMAGRKHSPETIEKIRQANTGRKHSEATRKMMSERNKGIRFTPDTPEWRRKLGDASRGKPHSQELCEKMRQIRLENNPASKHYIVTFPDGHEETIFNLARFCREQGLKENCLREAMRCGHKHQGYRCRDNPQP